jgi:hypothetical protein
MRWHLHLSASHSARQALSPAEVDFLAGLSAARTAVQQQMVLRHMPRDNAHVGGGATGADPLPREGPTDAFVFATATVDLGQTGFMEMAVSAGEAFIIRMSSVKEYVARGEMMLR